MEIQGRVSVLLYTILLVEISFNALFVDIERIWMNHIYDNVLCSVFLFHAIMLLYYFCMPQFNEVGVTLPKFLKSAIIFV